ncbi:sigma factor-like helix-turn-helix DNA-binding protein [Paenibacillus lentus]|uniref:Sigma-70 family RNA polymerase sigma factor n=1 Tax=Paenibacillus lentus TaxID=1338368 RepID=A0A3Q8S3Q7_9BACL|nr:sigma factor-like helix-turn-helix DNA-binding protein [Paenibacillus lentus]AZK45310.1 sigma-70 family RNA polymerase sigma factor [Paenibacillus lentus]
MEKEEKRQTTIYDYYKSEIYRIGWRIQYQAKKVRKRECPFYDYNFSYPNFASITEDKIWINEIMDSLPPQGKLVIDKLYFQDLTESDVAQQLKISQQAVNKWKQKMLEKLSQTINY